MAQKLVSRNEQEVRSGEGRSQAALDTGACHRSRRRRRWASLGRRHKSGTRGNPPASGSAAPPSVTKAKAGRGGCARSPTRTRRTPNLRNHRVPSRGPGEETLAPPAPMTQRSGPRHLPGRSEDQHGGGAAAAGNSHKSNDYFSCGPGPGREETRVSPCPSREGEERRGEDSSPWTTLAFGEARERSRERGGLTPFSPRSLV